MNELLFALTKILKVLTEPASLLVLGISVSCVLLWLRRLRTGRVLLSLCTIFLLIVSATPLANSWMAALELRFPRPDLAAMPAPDGILVLGGSVAPGIATARGAIALTPRGERIAELAMLARRFPLARLIHTGGTASLHGTGPLEPAGIAPFATDLGIADGRLEFENASRNTFENAVFSKNMVRPSPGERWLLVTSAAHMPRSVGIFRSIGWEIIPFPVDYEALPTVPWIELNPIRNWTLANIAAHETLGMIVYYVTGHSASLFPGPEQSPCDGC